MRGSPSYYSGFAPRDGIPRYPSLWKGCVGAWAPCLGPTGAQLMDWSGYRNHGTLTNMDLSASWSAGHGKYGLTFDGSNDYVDLGTNLDQNGPVTISAWINTNTIAAGRLFVVANNNSGGTNQDYSLEINRTSGRLGTVWGGAVILTASTTMSTAIWYHAAIVRSGSSGSWTATLYLNGKSDGTTTTATNPNATNERTAIGRAGNQAAGFFNGQIDDVRIYNRGLSATEIATLALRRGVAYERDDTPAWRAADVAGGTFQAYWARRQSQFIGGGLM